MAKRGCRTVHPAYSVILFTTASGAGYGLLVWLSALRLFGVVPADRTLGLLGLGSSLGLVTLGLLSSTAHLGHPERAWRALSQWRSSWLSREGVMAVATYIPAGLLGIGWGLLGWGGFLVGLTALAAVALALATVWCTGMIYASLRTIRQWHQPLTAPIYVALALATGGILANLLLAATGHGGRLALGGTLAAVLVAGFLKWRYWRAIDDDVSPFSIEAATGLGHLGTVRPLDPPHTQENFVMREMGYQVGRRHRLALRAMALAALFLVPLVTLVAALLGNGGVALPASIAATTSAAVGVLVERWLFFAEARHVAMLYYRR
jgi:DMSO reductase anchor subunit